MGKSSNRMGTSGAVSVGAQLENMRYQNQASLPNQHDNDAQFFSDIAKSFSRPGDRARGGWRNFGEGLAKGAEYGARSQSISQRKENFDKNDQVMNYLQEVNNASIKQNQWHEKREAELAAIQPYAVGGLEVAYSGMPYEQGNERMRNLVEQAKLNNPNIKGDYVGYIPNSPIVNMRDENGNITALSLSSFAGEDVVKRVQGNFIDQQKVNTEREFAPIKYRIQGDRIHETARRNDQNANKMDIKLHETLGKKIDASEDFLRSAPGMRKIVMAHPDIFQSAKDAIWRNSKEPGYLDNFIKNMSNKLAPEKVTALTSLIKDINRMTLNVANGFSRPNMFIEKVGSKAVPNLDMNAQGFLDNLQKMEDEEKRHLGNNLSRLEILESNEDKPLTQDYKNSTNEVMNSQQTTPPQANSTDDPWDQIGSRAQ